MKDNSKNKKGKYIVLALILIAVFAGGIYIYYSNINNDNSNYEPNKVSSNNQVNENSENTSNKENKSDENNNTAENNVNQTNITSNITNYKEEELSNFTTTIYSNDEARQNNINITCNTLNGTIVKNGATFSFCDTVGQATSSKGYMEADIFDHDGHKKKGYGGGNCQVSSTLYNAILTVPSLTVTERHAHSNSVPYVAKGKDAAVAFGSYDLKFVNNSGNDIKILLTTDGNYVVARIVSLIPA